MRSQIICFIAVVIVFFATILIFSKPTEEDYFKQIATDYGNNHKGMSLSISDLKAMGSSSYTSNLFYSSYTYQFGNLKVHYWGILGNIFNKGYENLGALENNNGSEKV